MTTPFTDPAYEADKASIDRRRRMIDALMAPQARQGQIGGIAIPMSGAETAARVLAQALGMYASTQTDQQSKDLGEKYQAEMNRRLTEGLSQYDHARTGTPYPQPANDDEGNPMPAVPSSPPDARGAMISLLNSGHPILQQLGASMMTKASPVGNVSPADFTPASVAKFSQSGNYGDLVPKANGEFVDQGDRKALIDKNSGNPIGAPLPVAKREFVQSNGQNVMADVNAIPLGTPVNPGILPKDMADLYMRGAQVGDARTNTMYNTGQTPGVFMPPGLGGGGFMTGPQPGVPPVAPRSMIAGGPNPAIASGGPPNPAGAGPTTLPPKLLAEAQAAGLRKEGEGLAQGGVDYKNGLDASVKTGGDLMMRIAESRKAMDQFQPGMGAEARLVIARAAKAAGAPDSLVEKINQGDISAKQEFMKLSAQQAMETLKQSMGGAGRITQSEFKVFQANNPNIELDPQAIQKIYNFATRVYQRDSTEQQQLAQHIKGGGRLSEWPALWNQKAQQLGLIDPQIVDVKDGASVNPKKTGLVPNAQGGFDYVPPGG